MKRHRIVVHRGHSALRIGAWIGAVLLLLAMIGMGLVYLRDPHAGWMADPDSEIVQLREERKRLVRDLRQAREELDDLRGQSTFVARSCEIDSQACEALRTTVTGLESDLVGLRQQLALYRSIVSPDQPHTGLRVLQLALRPGAEVRHWIYDLVLVQPLQRNRLAEGTYLLVVEGLEDGKLRSYPVHELEVGAAPDRAFAFRAFQEFSGELRLPPGFLPSRVTVTLSIDNGSAKSGTVEESHDWSRLVEAGKE